MQNQIQNGRFICLAERGRLTYEIWPKAGWICRMRTTLCARLFFASVLHILRATNLIGLPYVISSLLSADIAAQRTLIKVNRYCLLRRIYRFYLSKGTNPTDLNIIGCIATRNCLNISNLNYLPIRTEFSNKYLVKMTVTATLNVCCCYDFKF